MVVFINFRFSGLLEKPDLLELLLPHLTVIPAKDGAAKSKKALNHKDTKAQRKPFLSPGRSLSRPGKNFVPPCLCDSLLFRAFCNTLLREHGGLVEVLPACGRGASPKSGLLALSHLCNYLGGRPLLVRANVFSRCGYPGSR